MTEQPDPTRELDLSEVEDATPAEAEERQEDIVEGEPGWDDGGDVPEDRAPGDDPGGTVTRSAAPDGRITGDTP
jgi:hypothetical protein